MGTNALLCVVDDDESVRDSVAVLLKSIGFLVTVFASAHALLASSALDEIRCLVLDVRMPGMTGPELQRHLAGAGRRIPIIFITAQADARVRTELLGLGAIAFLPKPFDPDVLFEAVHEALELS